MKKVTKSKVDFFLFMLIVSNSRVQHLELNGIFIVYLGDKSLAVNLN